MNTSDRDDELSRRLAATLERSLDTLDGDALARLAAARRDAVHHRQRVRRVVGGLALAAGIAAIAVVPLFKHQGGHLAQPVVEGDMSYLTVEPQMLSDMEMLETLGEGSMDISAGALHSAS